MKIVVLIFATLGSLSAFGNGYYCQSQQTEAYSIPAIQVLDGWMSLEGTLKHIDFEGEVPMQNYIIDGESVTLALDGFNYKHCNHERSYLSIDSDGLFTISVKCDGASRFEVLRTYLSCH